LIFGFLELFLKGITNGSLNVGCRNVDFSAFKPPLRRNVKHILDFGLRPKECPPLPPFQHYQSTDVIRMTDLVLPVVYKSPHFCCTGWGTHSLSLGELACAFDLPSHCIGNLQEAAILSQLFPFKLLSKPLHFVLESLVSTSPPPALLLGPALLRGLQPTTCDELTPSLLCDVSIKFSKLAADLKIAAPLLLNGIPNPVGQGIPGKQIWFHDPPGITWLPALVKFLPDSWCNKTLISDKAVKSDEEPVPHHLWDNRIQLVIPSATDLPGFQTLALLWQHKDMYKQLRRFLKIEHGNNWTVCLANTWRQTAQAALQVVGPLPRERSRGGAHSSPVAGPAEEA
jgi:hypothetical protein